MVNEQKPYKALVLPFGLFQVIPNFPKMDPTSDEFDLARTIEYAASPLHYIVGRDTSDSGGAFLNDLRNGELSRDLNDYGGFRPATSIGAEGLASPSWGATIKFKEVGNAFQGVYVGAGPYLSMQTEATLDQALSDLFASETPVYTPNTSYYMSNHTVGQVALAVTGGYRARFELANGSGPQDGLYVGANYHYLHGFEYQQFEPDARLDTNAQGLLVVNPALGLPVTITQHESNSGTGFALDVGGAVLINRWQVGFGVNGIANRINWTDVERTSYVLDSLFTGGEFQDLDPELVEDIEVELPVDVRANAAYSFDDSTAIVEFGQGYNDTTVRLGYEHRFDRFQLRGGARYIKDQWEPTGGVGFDLTPGFGLDVGLFSTSANFERERHLAIAFSLRFMRDNTTP
jgi:hypothetical protein